MYRYAVLLLLVVGCSGKTPDGKPSDGQPAPGNTPPLLAPEELVKDWKAWEGKRVRVQTKPQSTYPDVDQQVIIMHAGFISGKGAFKCVFPLTESAKIVNRQDEITVEGIASVILAKIESREGFVSRGDRPLTISMNDCRVISP